MAARPQHPVLARGLVRFARTGAISAELQTELRIHARSGAYPDHFQAARLNRYAASRSPRLGPVGANFGAACHQIDRADLMLADLRERIRQGQVPPPQAWPETDGPPVIAMARRDPQGQTVTFVLDATTANIALFAIAGHADEREAHLHEVQRHAQDLPEGSYGRANRQAIAARETRPGSRTMTTTWKRSFFTLTINDTSMTSDFIPSTPPRRTPSRTAGELILAAPVRPWTATPRSPR